jgi:hypothetical protein
MVLHESNRKTSNEVFSKFQYSSTSMDRGDGKKCFTPDPSKGRGIIATIMPLPVLRF